MEYFYGYGFETGAVLVPMWGLELSLVDVTVRTSPQRLALGHVLPRHAWKVVPSTRGGGVSPDCGGLDVVEERVQVVQAAAAGRSV